MAGRLHVIAVVIPKSMTEKANSMILPRWALLILWLVALTIWPGIWIWSDLQKFNLGIFILAPVYLPMGISWLFCESHTRCFDFLMVASYLSVVLLHVIFLIFRHAWAFILLSLVLLTSAASCSIPRGHGL